MLKTICVPKIAMQRVVTWPLVLPLTVIILLSTATGANGDDAKTKRPNILWLTAEDIGPEIGCYGDTMADTPAIDRFAKDSLRFKTAWSNYPVCAPARTTIITGSYACCGAAGNMRSNVPLPKDMVMFPSLLRKAGYYCTNNYKEDYNYLYKKSIDDPSEMPWDQSSKKAHYKNRAEGQPFFAVFNYVQTHESKIRTRPHDAVIAPDRLTLPPFWPDVPEVRTDLGQYYDNIAKMDRWFNEKIKELHDAGLADDTIVFFYGDHGSGMPRFKRYAGDTGYKVAMIVHVPTNLRTDAVLNSQAVGVSDRLVGFADLAPTVLSLAGIKPPASMVGRSWFGEHKSADPDYIFGFRERMDERGDLSHCIRDQRYQYTVNYMPHLPAGQILGYQQQTPTTSKWMEMFHNGETNAVQSQFWQPRRCEEFYDLENDPWATNNLIDDPQQKSRVAHFRKTHQKKTLEIHDLGFIAEPIVAGLTEGKTTISELRQMLPRVFQAAQLASLKADDPSTDPAIIELLQGGSSINPSQQSWALIGLRLRQDRLADNEDAITAAIKLLDADSFLAIDAADCLLAMGKGDQDRCLKILMHGSNLNHWNYQTALRSCNALEKHKALLTESQLQSIRDLPIKPANSIRGTGDLKKLISRF